MPELALAITTRASVDVFMGGVRAAAIGLVPEFAGLDAASDDDLKV